MERFLKRVSNILTIVFGLVILFILGSFIPSEKTYTFHIVESGSMEPAIRTGAVVATIPHAAYGVGDVVTFAGTETNRTPTTHRIIDTETVDGETLFVTKGDANEDPDFRRIGPGEILGKVFLAVPYAGYVVALAQTRTGIILFIFVPLTLILLSEAVSIFRWIARRKEKKIRDEGIEKNENELDQ